MPKCKRFILLLELCWFCQKFCISAWGCPVGLLHHLAQPIVPGLPRPRWSVWPLLCAAPCAVICMVTRVHVLFIEESWGLWHVSNALQAVLSVHKASNPRHNGSPYKRNPQSIYVLLHSRRMHFPLQIWFTFTYCLLKHLFSVIQGDLQDLWPVEGR